MLKKRITGLFLSCLFVLSWNLKIEANEEIRVEKNEDGNTFTVILGEHYTEPFNTAYNNFVFDREKVSEVKVSENNATYTSKDGVLYSKNMDVMFFYPPQKKDEVFELPEQVETMESWVNSPYLKELILSPKFHGDIRSGEYLESIKVPESNDTYTSKDGILYSRDMDVMVFYPPQKKDEVFELPEQVEYMENIIKSPYLKEITLSPNTVEFHGGGICSGEAFEAIKVPEENNNFTSMDGVLYSKDMKIIYEYPRAKKGEKFKIPKSVEEIGDYCFFGSPLREITCPCVKIVGECAFNWCYYLENVEFCQVEEIKDDAFVNCRNLNKIVLPQSVREVGRFGSSVNEIVFAGEKSVADVHSQWAEKELTQAKENGLITEKVSYGAKSRIARSEVCELVINMVEKALGAQVESQEDLFADTSDRNAEKCCSIGIINGVGENRLSPGTFVSREQMATIIYRSLKYICAEKGINMEEETEISENYKDKDSVSTWAAPAMATLNKNGIMKGTSEDMLSPHESLTVEEAVILVNRAYETVQ